MDNISDIISSLSENDIDNLKEMAQSLFGENKNEKDKDSQSMPDLGVMDPKLIGKITNIMSLLNKRDIRCELIAALKPFLSENKQKRADEAMKILRLMELIPMLKDQE